MIYLYLFLLLGIILNFIGPLANHLKKEDKYTLNTSSRNSWFFKCSLISLIRIVSILIYPLFYFNYYVRKVKPIKPVIFEDKLNQGLVRRLRSIGEYNNTAPSSKTTDEKIIEIYRLICSSFKKQSELRNEHIKADCLNTIAIKFFKVYEEFGEDFMQGHLEHDLKKYTKEGLRPEYKKGISLF